MPTGSCEMAVQETGARPSMGLVNIELRYRYNPDVKSLVAIAPAVILMMLLLFPAMLTALSVVWEKELGSIVNFYVTPISKVEFLLGKQLPYVALAMLNYVLLVFLAVTMFGVPLTGSFRDDAGRSSIRCRRRPSACCSPSSCAARLPRCSATAIGTILPAVQFSGLINPVSSLEGAGAVIGSIYPATWFVTICRGASFPRGWLRRPLAWTFSCCSRRFPSSWRCVSRCCVSRRADMRHAANIYRLGIKELRSLWRDPMMLFLILYSFSVGIYVAATAMPETLHKAPIAIVDEDQSQLSSRITGAFYPPHFTPPSIVGLERSGQGAGCRALYVRSRHPARFSARRTCGTPTRLAAQR